MLGIPVVFCLSSTYLPAVLGISFQLQSNNPLLSSYLIGISFSTKGTVLPDQAFFVKNHASHFDMYDELWCVTIPPYKN